MSEPLMPHAGRDQRSEPTPEDIDLEVGLDEQGGQDPVDSDGDTSQDAAQGDPPFITPRAGDSLSPEELRRES